VGNANEQTLRVAFPGAAKQLDPAFYSVIEEHQIGFTLFDALVWVDHTLTPQPMLAESWDASPTLRSWTFKLREGVRFHHGATFSAQDVTYTFSRILNPDTGSPFRSTLQFVEKVEALDEYTVRFDLKTPSAELPLLLGAPQARIVPHDLPSALLTAKPSGTGPFQLISHEVGLRTRLMRNPQYWQPDQPAVEGLEFLFIPQQEQVAALQKGHVDLLMQVGVDEAEALRAETDLAVNSIVSGAYQTIVMRATTAPFDNALVREAFKFCVDRTAMLARVLRRSGVTGNDHPVAPFSPFWADLPLRPYDPARARTLLSKNGYAKGIKIDLLTSTVRPGMEEMARAFAEMAKPAGITIRVVRAPASAYWSNYAGHVPFHTGNWSFRPSIDETFMTAYHSSAKGNESNWRNPALDDLIEQARGERQEEARKALYRNAQQLLIEEGAVIIPYFKPTALAMRKVLRNFTPHPAGWLDFRTTSLVAA
jgi:peptide/nickel transport system substrate-binding protein